jgi:hypothetical protein
MNYAKNNTRNAVEARRGVDKNGYVSAVCHESSMRPISGRNQSTTKNLMFSNLNEEPQLVRNQVLSICDLKQHGDSPGSAAGGQVRFTWFGYPDFHRW